MSVVLPVRRWGKANGILKEKLEEIESRSSLSVQERYDRFEKAIREVEKELGERKSKPSTDDKISNETKRLIEKRTKLRTKVDPKQN